MSSLTNFSHLSAETNSSLQPSLWYTAQRDPEASGLMNTVTFFTVIFEKSGSRGEHSFLTADLSFLENKERKGVNGF